MTLITLLTLVSVVICIATILRLALIQKRNKNFPYSILELRVGQSTLSGQPMD